jgi:hypothetical protein
VPLRFHGSVFGPFRINIVDHLITAPEPKRLNLQSGGFDSKIKLYRRRRAAVTDSKLPHEVVCLLERFG